MYGRVLVGTDGSPTAARAVDRAVELARATDSRLIVLSAGESDRAERTARSEADRVAATGVPVEARTAKGDPASALLDVAEAEGVGLIVVGNRGMAGAGRLLGSVPSKVSHHAGCAVLIVHTT